MIQKPVFLFVSIFIFNLLFLESALSFAEIKPEKQYRNVFVTVNNDVYGVTYEKNIDGKYTAVKLTGKEKVKVILYKFTMKDDVTIDMLKSDENHKFISDILKIEKKSSVKLLREWLKDTSQQNRDKAAYLLNIIGNTSH